MGSGLKMNFKTNGNVTVDCKSGVCTYAGLQINFKKMTLPHTLHKDLKYKQHELLCQMPDTISLGKNAS